MIDGGNFKMALVALLFLASVSAFGADHENRLSHPVEVFKGSLTRTEVYRGFLGEMSELKTYSVQTGKILGYQKIGAEGRTEEIYDHFGQLERQVVWKATLSGVDATTRLFKGGRQVSKFTDHLSTFDPALAENECTRNIAPIEFDGRGLANIFGQIFGTGRATSSQIRIRQVGCERTPGLNTIQTQVQNAMTVGLSCLNGLGAQRQRDAQLILALMSNPSPQQQFTLQCSNFRAPDPRANFAGFGTICPNQFEAEYGNGASQSGLARYPGITLNTALLSSNGRLDSSEQMQRTLFHEALHTIGHMHGHAPEVCYACEACCFGVVDRNAPNAGVRRAAACSLCNETGTITPDSNYFGRLLESARDLYDPMLASTTARAMILGFARRFAAGDPPQSDAFGRMARSIQNSCPEHDLSRCSEISQRAYGLLALTQNALSPHVTPLEVPEPMTSIERVERAYVSSAVSYQLQHPGQDPGLAMLEGVAAVRRALSSSCSESGSGPQPTSVAAGLSQATQVLSLIQPRIPVPSAALINTSQICH